MRFLPCWKILVALRTDLGLFFNPNDRFSALFGAGLVEEGIGTMNYLMCSSISMGVFMFSLYAASVNWKVLMNSAFD